MTDADVVQPWKRSGGNRVRNLAIAAGVFAVASYAIRSTPSQRLAADLQAVARSVQATLPQQLDQRTRLEAVQGAQHALHYTIRITDARKADIDRPALRAELQPRLREIACGRLRDLLSRGAYLAAKYVDRDGAEVTSLAVPPSACGFQDPEDVASVMVLYQVNASVEDHGMPVPSAAPTAQPARAEPGASADDPAIRKAIDAVLREQRTKTGAPAP
jgi:hypothetical protein